MIKFREYVLIKESDLEDLFVSDDPTDNIELLHEMEYKLRQIVDNRHRMNPKLYVNIIKRFGNFALEAYEDLSPKFIELYNYWLDMHSVHDPMIWAEKLYDEYEDQIESNEAVGVGGVSVTKDEIIKNMSRESVDHLLDYYYGGDLINNFGISHVGDFLKEREIPPPIEDEEDLEYDPDYWQNNEDEAIEKVYELDLEEEFEQYIIDLIHDEPIFFDHIPLDRESWINGIAEVLYPKYYGIHGYNIESVTPDIEEARERFEEADKEVERGYDILSNIDLNDKNMDSDIETFMKIIGDLTIALSLGMNVVHTGGNLITDYGYRVGLDGMDIDYLSNFNARDVKDWNDELRKIVRNYGS